MGAEKGNEFDKRQPCGKWLQCTYATPANQRRVHAHVVAAEADAGLQRCSDTTYMYAVGIKNAVPTGKDRCTDPALATLITLDDECDASGDAALPACNHATPLDRATTLAYAIPGGVALFVNVCATFYVHAPVQSRENSGAWYGMA